MSTLVNVQPLSKPNSGKVALSLILMSESVFFATLLVAYAALRNQTNWPIDHNLARLTIPLMNTAILFLSVFPAWRAIVSVRDGKQSALLNWLVVTLLLGLIFVTGQVYEFRHAGLHINDQAFGGVFFTLMGFHALHVLAGVVLMLINLVRAHLGDFSPNHYNLIELGTWFWYYVTAVWLVLFAALYLL